MTILIRHAGPEDEPTLRYMHAAQGFAYELPPLFDGNGKWAVRAILEEDGQPQMAVLLRRTAEEYLLISPVAGDGSERIGKILAIQKEATDAAKRVGYTDIHCWLPDDIEKGFGRHLIRMGWASPQWKCFTRDI